jgi:hypothetical protein
MKLKYHSWLYVVTCAVQRLALRIHGYIILLVDMTNEHQKINESIKICRVCTALNTAPVCLIFLHCCQFKFVPFRYAASSGRVTGAELTSPHALIRVPRTAANFISLSQ